MTALFALLAAALLVGADQLTKYLVTANFDVGQSRTVIDGVLELTYVRNDGAVFGSLSGKGYIFNTITVLVVVVGIALIVSGKIKPKLLVWAGSLVISGGVGNLIDRFRLRYVVDFIDVKCFGSLWRWVFNVADVCVVVGCGLIILYFIIDSVREGKRKKAADAVEKGLESVQMPAELEKRLEGIRLGGSADSADGVSEASFDASAAAPDSTAEIAGRDSIVSDGAAEIAGRNSIAPDSAAEIAGRDSIVSDSAAPDSSSADRTDGADENA